MGRASGCPPRLTTVWSQMSNLRRRCHYLACCRTHTCLHRGRRYPCKKRILLLADWSHEVGTRRNLFPTVASELGRAFPPGKAWAQWRPPHKNIQSDRRGNHPALSDLSCYQTSLGCMGSVTRLLGRVTASGNRIPAHKPCSRSVGSRSETCPLHMGSTWTASNHWKTSLLHTASFDLTSPGRRTPACRIRRHPPICYHCYCCTCRRGTPSPRPTLTGSRFRLGTPLV